MNKIALFCAVILALACAVSASSIQEEKKHLNPSFGSSESSLSGETVRATLDPFPIVLNSCGCSVCPCASPASPVTPPGATTTCGEAGCERAKLAQRQAAESQLQEELVKYEAQLDGVDTNLRGLRTQFYLVQNRHQLLLAALGQSYASLSPAKPDAPKQESSASESSESSAVAPKEYKLPANFASVIPANLLYKRRMQKKEEAEKKAASTKTQKESSDDDESSSF